MTMTNQKPVLLVLWLSLTFGSCLSAQTLDGAVPASGPKVVSLTSGTCVQVSEGDILTFEWNPAFDATASVQGLANFELAFAGEEESQHPGRRTPSLVLSAMSHDPARRAAGQPVTAAINGFYQIRFRVKLASLHPGDYKLVAASATPVLPSDFQGSSPRMTNNPIQYPFCITVLPQPGSRRR